MAIEKNSFKVVPSARLDSELESISSEDDDSRRVDFDFDEDDFNDCDSGAGSDDFDLLELGETGEEFCQIGDQTCSIPFELYDLPGLNNILSMDAWNDVLTDEERLNLTKYLPDMDQETFMRTMKELFTGCNFHFGSPINNLFNMLKGGLCEPRVSLYRQGLGFFQKTRHYHVIKKHQNTMVNNILQIRDAWMKCRGYSIEEKLRVLNIMKSQKSLMYEKMEELETDSSEWEEFKDRKSKQAHLYRAGPALALEPAHFGKQNPKGTLKVTGSKTSITKEQTGPFSSMEMKPGPSGSFFSQDDEEERMYDVTVHRDRSFSRACEKKFKGLRGDEFRENFVGLTDMHAFGGNRTVNQLSDIKVLTSKPSSSRFLYDYGKKVKRTENNSQHDMYAKGDPFWFDRSREPVSVDLAYRPEQKKGRVVSTQNGGRIVAAAEGMKRLAKGEETESDSSEQFGEDNDDSNPLMRSKWAYPRGSSGFKKGKLGNNNKKSVKTLGKNRFDNNINIRHMDDTIETYMPQPGNFNGDVHIKVLGEPETTETPLRKTYFAGKKQKGEFGIDYSTLPSMYDYIVDEPGVHQLGPTKKGPEPADVRLLSCNSVSKKRKVKNELIHNNEQENFPNGLEKGKRKWADPDPGPFENDSLVFNTEEDPELEIKSRKKPFTLITPTVHTGFSFSIIHLLSAVRAAMITLLPEDTTEGLNPDNPEVPSLTVKDIVNRVRSNPGDPCILETQEPLQDLVRGVLKLFSSKTAPLGAKAWKPLVSYKKPLKTWSWVGPILQNGPDHEEVTSPDAWNLPHKTLVKLVDSFANWLKSGQETLQQIGSLPAPPLTLMQLNLDEKERFRDLRAQKSLNTINPSSDEVREYFRKEEMLRYLIPDRAFAYTAVDGKKSTVAPSRKGAGKPTSKARDHFMLKRDRPPHVTILCLVRDAASRLPGSIGTRADVCTLIRDSQYIVEDVSDAQVNQVVSGALDRLHYERDPCVQFDGERKLWVYLHRDREEEDFEDDGTSSTKKWKRQKKELVEPSDHGPGAGVGQSGFELGSDLNVEPCGTEAGLDEKLLCGKNSRNEDFEDDMCGRDEDAEVFITSVS